MSLEYQRYGRDRETLVNHTYISSGAYRKKFDCITNDKNVNRVLYMKAKKMLMHRSGTRYEDMYWVNGKTGNIIASILDSSQEKRIAYTASVLKSIKHASDIISLHTHPNSMPPSIGDFNSFFEHRYFLGIVICHNGKIFCYKSEELIGERIYMMYIENYIKEGFQEYDAQINALNQIKRNYQIDFWEV